MSHSPDAIYHMALPDDWNAARPSGTYDRSTRGKSLDEVGYIHCSFPAQLTKVANRLFPDVAELIVLEIDPELLTAEVRLEPVGRGDDELFPHVYGPVNTSSVVDSFWWERGDDGLWHQPSTLGSIP